MSGERPTPLHQLAFYDDVDAFLGTALPYLREGLEADEPVLVALGPARTELLRGSLGAAGTRARLWMELDRLG